VALWRGYTGNLPETDRAVAARQIQMRATEASEQLVEKTKALAAAQQDSIDQLQALQEQMQGVRRLLAAQQNDNKRLSDQVGGLASAVDSLRQSFASAQPSEAADSPPSRHDARRPKTHAIRAATPKHRKPAA
jgi:peptidoglycan hydrolase CwlO-like protein